MTLLVVPKHRYAAAVTSDPGLHPPEVTCWTVYPAARWPEASTGRTFSTRVADVAAEGCGTATVFEGFGAVTAFEGCGAVTAFEGCGAVTMLEGRGEVERVGFGAEDFTGEEVLSGPAGTC